jgi:hypothetical protein
MNDSSNNEDSANVNSADDFEAMKSLAEEGDSSYDD